MSVAISHEGPQDMGAFVASGAPVRTGTAGLVVIALGSQGGATAGRLMNAATDTFGQAARIVRARARIVVTAHELSGDADAVLFAEEIRSRLARAVGDPRLAAGVAHRGRGGGLSTAVIQAEQALLLGRSLYGDARTIPFDTLGLYRFVLGRPTQELDAFCDERLGPLASCGTPRSEELLLTLSAYLRRQGNLNRVARDLYLHRNTVRYRLKQIAELTGADLRDAEACLGLQLALLTRRALTTMDAQRTSGTFENERGHTRR